MHTKEVIIKNVKIGKNNPIAIQSMISCDATNIEKSIEQILLLKENQCNIARLAIQGKKQVIACERIKNILEKKNIDIAIVADVHFYPPAALEVIDFVDKVRINPGNFVNKEELIEDIFTPLVLKCKKLKKAMRIGANKGSLAKYLIDKFKTNSEQALIESVFLFADICIKNDFHNFLFSIKTSDPLSNIEVNSLLYEKMKLKGYNYPIHLGVTEAGFGIEAVLKSSLSIGNLLLRGIGDTIRISLTDDIVEEVKIAKKIIKEVNSQKEKYVSLKKRKVIDKINVFFHLNDINETEKIKTFENNVDGFIVKRKNISLIEYLEAKKLKHFIIENKINETIFDANIVTTNDIDIIMGKRDFSKIFYMFNVDEKDKELSSIQLALRVGFLIYNNYIDGIIIEGRDVSLNYFLIFYLLQILKKKESIKANFISCPSCGRTLFDIQKLSRSIYNKIQHIKDLKIAVMGCIVNGLGEVADADFGCVGSKSNKVDFYVKGNKVKKNIDCEIAAEEFIELIKDNNKWKDN